MSICMYIYIYIHIHTYIHQKQTAVARVAARPAQAGGDPRKEEGEEYLVFIVYCILYHTIIYIYITCYTQYIICYILHRTYNM